MPKTERSATEQDLAKLKRSISQLQKEAPELQQAFGGFLDACLTEGVGGLDCRTKELIIVGIAIGKNCKPCTQLHVSKALQAGATRAEIIEAGYMGMLMGGGPAFTTMQYLLETLDDLEE
ncbi:MAG: carboxymuconolactone decarboxylase family protein [Armatimonadota bacterium]